MPYQRAKTARSDRRCCAWGPVDIKAGQVELVKSRSDHQLRRRCQRSEYPAITLITRGPSLYKSRGDSTRILQYAPTTTPTPPPDKRATKRASHGSRLHPGVSCPAAMIGSQMRAEATHHRRGQERNPRRHADSTLHHLYEPGRGQYSQIEGFGDSPLPKPGHKQLQKVASRPLANRRGPEAADIFMPGRESLPGRRYEFHGKRPDVGNPADGPIDHQGFGEGRCCCHSSYCIV